MNYIDEKDIVKEKTELLKATINLEKYDMYYIDFLLKTGETKRIRTFCEKGIFSNPKEIKEMQRWFKERYNEDLLEYFFITRLLGNKGLMCKEGRDDYIYLGGELGQNNCVASRYMQQSNGKTGQQNFDENLFNIKLQVEAREKNNNFMGSKTKGSEARQKDSQARGSTTSSENTQKGKIYAVGDIHGMYGSYADVMKKMTPRDEIVILGDVIDRGDNGIQILQDIIKRKQDENHNPKITFMLGNHEMQFLIVNEIVKREGLSEEEIEMIMNRWTALVEYSHYNSYSDSKSMQLQQEWNEKFEKYDDICKKIGDKKGLNDNEMYNMGVWLVSNKGRNTFFDFLHMNEKEQDDMITFLENSYVTLPKNINGNDYLFVHAMPPRSTYMLYRMKQVRDGYKYKDLPSRECEFILQEREHSTYEQAKEAGFITVCGHTPDDDEKIVIDNEKGFVRIDAGCGHRGKLALYCIDDGRAEYFDEKETVQEFPEL